MQAHGVVVGGDAALLTPHVGWLPSQLRRQRRVGRSRAEGEESRPAGASSRLCPTLCGPRRRSQGGQGLADMAEPGPGRASLPSRGLGTAPWPRSALAGRQHHRGACVFPAEASVPVLEETKATVLEEKVSSPGAEKGPRKQKHRSISPRCPTARARSAGPRDAKSLGPARVPPRAPGRALPACQPLCPRPSPVSRTCLGWSAPAFSRRHSGLAGGPLCGAPCTPAGLRDPHSIPCDYTMEPRLRLEHTELCLPSGVPAVCPAPSLEWPGSPFLQLDSLPCGGQA